MFKSIKKIFNKEPLPKIQDIKNILAVEDQPKNAELFNRALQRPGYNLLIAGDRENGFQMAEQYRPSLIILNAMLQGEKTVDLCARLKQSDSTKHIPILTIAEENDKLNIVEYYEQKVDEYLIKPFSVKELFNHVEMLINEVVQEIDNQDGNDSQKI